MQVLYETLAPASKQKILTGKKVVDIQTTRDGVQVHCLDNTTYEGSIVIGADGVHSKTRGFMRSMALAAGADPATVNPEKPLIASYRCMVSTLVTYHCAAPSSHPTSIIVSRMVLYPVTNRFLSSGALSLPQLAPSRATRTTATAPSSRPRLSTAKTGPGSSCTSA